MNAKRIAVDLAKPVFQVAESTQPGKVSRRLRLSRPAFERYLAEQEGPVEWVMEACGSAHHWGRVVQGRGQVARLLPAHQVAAYRLRNKTDRNDYLEKLRWPPATVRRRPSGDRGSAHWRGR